MATNHPAGGVLNPKLGMGETMFSFFTSLDPLLAGRPRCSNPPSQDMAMSKMAWEDLKSVPCITFEASCEAANACYNMTPAQKDGEFVDLIFASE